MQMWPEWRRGEEVWVNVSYIAARSKIRQSHLWLFTPKKAVRRVRFLLQMGLPEHLCQTQLLAGGDTSLVKTVMHTEVQHSAVYVWCIIERYTWNLRNYINNNNKKQKTKFNSWVSWAPCGWTSRNILIISTYVLYSRKCLRNRGLDDKQGPAVKRGGAQVQAEGTATIKVLRPNECSPSSRTPVWLEPAGQVVGGDVREAARDQLL